MGEKSPMASDWRITLPEPARSYAESKLQPQRGIDYLAPLVLDFYYRNFSSEIIQLFENGDNNKGQELLLQENANLSLFFQWGYEHEVNSDQICRSSRITALLSPYWRWIEPDIDPLQRLNFALTAAQRNQDLEAQGLVGKAIPTLVKRGEFQTASSLVRGNNNLNSFEFEVVTVNNRGKIINKEKKQADYYSEDLGNDITLDMISIPDGTFIMGSPKGEGYKSEKPQHKVTIQPFFMGKYPVTQAQWKAIASRKDLKVKIDLNENPSRFKGDNLPVERINLYEAVEFCDRLTKLTGKNYRLPSESEWEYACRSVISHQSSVNSDELIINEWNKKYHQPFHFGATITEKLANYDASRTYADEPKGEESNQTTSVGQFSPNAFGLYDMHGNVWEWCADDWHDNYKKNNINSEKELRSVLRGGSWNIPPIDCRSAIRNNVTRAINYDDVGFRVVLCFGRTL